MKTSVVIIAIVCLALVAAVPRSPQRIVGGSLTTISQYPYGASLLYSYNLINYYQSCGGTILTNRAVLTAAHCVYGDAVSRWRVRVGSSYANSGGTVYTLSSIVVNSQYNPYTNDNDVAILKTSTNIVYGSWVKAGSIAGANYVLNDNSVVYAIGWGTVASGGAASEQLRHVQVWAINQATCKNRYATRGVAITDNMLCSGWLDVGGRDQCQGDSGGPLLHNNVVVGICSFGIGCADSYFPGVNTRVSKFTSWIQANA